MNWVGITNENEFYSQHYLAEIFSGDVRGVLEVWAEREAKAREAAKAQGQRDPAWRAPASALNALARDALHEFESLRRPQSPRERLATGRALLRQCLQVFDLPCEPQRQPLPESGDLDLPLLAELRNAQGEPLLWVLEAQALGEGEDFDADPLGLTVHPLQLQSLGEAPIPRSLTGTDAPDWSAPFQVNV